ncbi:hypothetical protein R3P38DRAFT_2815991 [Favolaschia claudopus]|uniref:Uncharacterized protein n=1 Tax=Favolaschia claudopus TaxID=2862362 RepID=A0AAV9Z1T8_9AGAR
MPSTNLGELKAEVFFGGAYSEQSIRLTAEERVAEEVLNALGVGLDCMRSKGMYVARYDTEVERLDLKFNAIYSNVEFHLEESNLMNNRMSAGENRGRACINTKIGVELIVDSESLSKARNRFKVEQGVGCRRKEKREHRRWRVDSKTDQQTWDDKARWGVEPSDRAVKLRVSWQFHLEESNLIFGSSGERRGRACININIDTKVRKGKTDWIQKMIQKFLDNALGGVEPLDRADKISAQIMCIRKDELDLNSNTITTTQKKEKQLHWCKIPFRGVEPHVYKPSDEHEHSVRQHEDTGSRSGVGKRFGEKSKRGHANDENDSRELIQVRSEFGGSRYEPLVSESEKTVGCDRNRTFPRDEETVDVLKSPSGDQWRV